MTIIKRCFRNQKCIRRVLIIFLHISSCMLSIELYCTARLTRQHPALISDAYILKVKRFVCVNN